jgi:uncharacterized protein YndB with AHSA1/START domain
VKARNTLVTTREIDAPVEAVWAAWNDPRRIGNWWGPAGFRSTVRALDVREGGRFDVIMYGPDGTEYPNLYIFDRVEEKKRLVYTNVGSEKFALAAFQSVFEMEAVGNRTRVVLTARFGTEEDWRKHVEEFGAIEGSEQLLERLEAEAGSAGQ